MKFKEFLQEQMKVKQENDFKNGQKYYIDGVVYKAHESKRESYDFELRREEDNELVFLLDKVWKNTYGKGDFYYRVVSYEGKYIRKLAPFEINRVVKG